MIKGNWRNVEPIHEGGRKRLPAGGYVARIKSVENVPAREYLKIEFDVTEGDFAGYYADLYERAHFWGGSFIRSYKASAAGFFRGFLDDISASNNGVDLVKENGEIDERQLIGKALGVILGAEEYEGNDGTIKTRLKVRAVVPVDRIRNNDFTVPELKRLSGSAPVTAAEVVDMTQATPKGFDDLAEELPF